MDQINLLPDHILTKIFGNLSPKLIKSCSLVCKRWDEIIGSSIELMERYQLVLRKQNVVKEANQINRKFQTAIVRNLSPDSLDVISRHKLQSLTLECCRGIKLSTLIGALNIFPTLKVLKMDYSEFIDDISGSSDFNKVRIHLEQLNCVVEIVHIFECSTIKILKTVWGHPVNDDRKMLIMNFLSRQKNLVHLNLHGEFSGNFFTWPDIFELKFSLEEFKHFCSFGPFLHYEAFIKFLVLHKKTLTSLEVYFYTEPKFGIELIHKYALENLLSLKHMELGYFEDEDDGYIGDELSFDELPSATQVTRNIESLAIRARSTDMNENRRFFAMFPNLKHLDFGGSDSDDIGLLYCISQINLNVETLKMVTLDDGTEQSIIIYFPKLKEFSVHGVDEDNLCAFINRHSKTLEKITLEAASYITHLTIKEILNCANLKYLELHLSQPNFSVMGIFDEISSKTKPFTFALISQFSAKQFIFPDDKAIWDEEIETLKNKIKDRCCAVQ